MNPTGFHVPSQTPGAKVSVFQSGMPTGAVSFQRWQKPRGISHVKIVCIDGAAGGANGDVFFGGGGGASAGGGIGLWSAWEIPDDLYVHVGLGGAANTAGAISYVAISPVAASTVSEIVLHSSNAAPGATTIQTAGAAATLGTSANNVAGFMGICRWFASVQGSNGGTGAGGPGGAITAMSSIGLTGGTGGGYGSSNSGGAITANGTFLGLAGGVGNAGGTGGNGNPGTLYRRPGLQYGPDMFRGCGGTGGGAGTTGGAGGRGATGCGGGGGGGGTNGGAAGRGGDGLVIISAW